MRTREADVRDAVLLGEGHDDRANARPEVDVLMGVEVADRVADREVCCGCSTGATTTGGGGGFSTAETPTTPTWATLAGAAASGATTAGAALTAAGAAFTATGAEMVATWAVAGAAWAGRAKAATMPPEAARTAEAFTPDSPARATMPVSSVRGL